MPTECTLSKSATRQRLSSSNNARLNITETVNVQHWPFLFYFALMESAVKYIIDFLLKGNSHLASRIGYTNNESLFTNYSVVIVPSGFFDAETYGTLASEPQLPLKEINGTPILFGTEEIKRQASTIVIHADLVASAFFLLSRYEEFIHPADNRDAHGRYVGKNSQPCRAKFINRPIVDEYADILLKCLSEAGCEVKFPPAAYRNIYLTHDIDFLTNYRHLRGFLGGIKRNLLSPKGLCRIAKSVFSLENDPAFTFRWILEQDSKVADAQQVYFVKSAVSQAVADYPGYNLNGKDFKKLSHLLKENNCKLGLHTSYNSANHLEYIKMEKAKLEQSLGMTVTASRWHFLRTTQPFDYKELLSAGITDDFTMGYADTAGFRLGTSRAVQWINPENLEVTNLTIHPLTAMDCTFSNQEYMNLTENEAEEKIVSLLNQTKKHNGDVVLLWHNTVFSELDGGYHKSLYTNIIKELAR